MGTRALGIQPPMNGTGFFVSDIPPGAAPMHRTNTMDDVIVLAGTNDLALPDESVSLRAGDVVVRYQTVAQPARIVVVLIDTTAPGVT